MTPSMSTASQLKLPRPRLHALDTCREATLRLQFGIRDVAHALSLRTPIAILTCFREATSSDGRICQSPGAVGVNDRGAKRDLRLSPAYMYPAYS